MKPRIIPVALALCLAAPSCATKNPPQQPKPGVWSRMTQVFHAPNKRNGSRRTSRVKGLAFTMELNPEVPKLSDDRRIKLTLVLANVSKKFVQLEFSTTQRIEVVVSDRSGKPLLRWSDDQSFAEEAGYLAINPGERVQYAVSIPTRDMSAGSEYLIEAFLPKYPNLKARRIIVPAP